MSQRDFGPTCGMFGCRESKADTVTIPGKGDRAVCEQHLEQLRVNGGVETDV